MKSEAEVQERLNDRYVLYRQEMNDEIAHQIQIAVRELQWVMA